MQQLMKSSQGTAAGTIPPGQIPERAGREQTGCGWIKKIQHQDCCPNNGADSSPQSIFSGGWHKRNYPPSGVKLRPSERRYKPYIVVLLVRLGTLPARQFPGRFAIGNLTGPEA